jgi:hypothetical protein
MRGPHKIDATADRAWLEDALGRLDANGYAVISGMLTPERVETYRDAVFRVREKTIAAIGREHFEQSVAAGNNELRLPFLFEPVFFDLLADPRVLALIDAVWLSPHHSKRVPSCVERGSSNPTPKKRNSRGAIFCSVLRP